MRGDVGETGQQSGGLREEAGAVQTVDTVADTLHHLAQSHRTTELEDSPQLDLLGVGEAGEEDLAAVQEGSRLLDLVELQLCQTVRCGLASLLGCQTFQSSQSSCLT